jgi:hypothetical protein
VGEILLNGYAGTITLERSLTATTFSQNSGTIQGQAPIYINGGGTWTGGTLKGDIGDLIENVSWMSVYIEQGATLDISGTVSLDARALFNRGTVNATGATINGPNFGFINNDVNARFNAIGDATTTSVYADFVNRGLVADTALNELNFYRPVENLAGTFKSEKVIRFNDTVAFAGGIPFAGEDGNLGGTGQVISRGGFSVTGDTTDYASILTVTGSASISGELTVVFGASFSGATSVTGKFHVNSGTTNLNGPVTVSGANAEVQVVSNVGARLNISADFTIDAGKLTNYNEESDAVSWKAGNINFQNNGTIQNNGDFSIGPDGDGIVGAAVGTMTGNGSFNNVSNLNPNSPGSVSVYSSATITVPFNNNPSCYVRFFWGTLTIDHDWTQRAYVAFSSGNLQVNGNFTNNGLVDVTQDSGSTGFVAVNTFTNNGQMRFDPLGNNMTSSLFTVRARIGVNNSGNFVQGANGRLEMRVRTNNPFDLRAANRLRVLGNTTLGGTLRNPGETTSRFPRGMV